MIPKPYFFLTDWTHILNNGVYHSNIIMK